MTVLDNYEHCTDLHSIAYMEQIFLSYFYIVLITAAYLT